jgi:hypothetical protein
MNRRRIKSARNRVVSLRYVNTFAPELPYTLREQVLDYARSVDQASHDISQEAEIELTEELRDQLVLVAGVRKLYAICSSSYWLLYNSTKLLGNGAAGIRVGGTTFSPEGGQFQRLSILLQGLEMVLAEQGLNRELIQQPYPTILSFLANERG